MDNRLGGVGEHGLEEIDIRHLCGHIPGRAQIHLKIDIGKGVDDLGCPEGIADPGKPPLARQRIERVCIGRAGAEIGLVVFQKHLAIAVTVAEHDPRGRGPDRPLYQAGGKTNPVSVDEGASLFK